MLYTFTGMHGALLIFLICLQVLLHAPSQLVAQANLPKSSAGYWFNYGGNHKLSDQWSLHTDFSLRNYLLPSNNQQALYRLGINRAIQGHNQLSLGYAYSQIRVETDQNPAPFALEHRSWEQYLVKHGLGPLGAMHRLRLEQRFFLSTESMPSSYSNRMRYLMQLELPMAQLSVNLKNYYVVLNNEYFVNFGVLPLQASFDRNRLHMALGYQWSPVFKTQLGYLQQAVAGQRQSLSEINHLVQLNVMFNVNRQQAVN
jgi:hypothetical protein